MSQFWTSVGGGLMTIVGGIAGGVVGSSLSPKRDAVMNGTLVGAGLTAVVWGIATAPKKVPQPGAVGAPSPLRFP
jgi:glycine zipper 2TM protein